MKTKEFKKGDKVKYTREPTEDDWKDIGEADIPFKLGDVLEVYSGSSKSVRFENYGYFYPTVCFELQEDTTDLTGRYVKALVNNANCIDCKIGDLFLVTDDNNINTHITRLSDGQPNWNLSKDYLGIEWELMPKDFNPNKSEELFAIQLHSQEKLDAIMSFYKEKGYKMQGSSDYYLDDFVVYIKPEYKTWQTAINNNENYPFKTLSELGITVNTKKDTTSDLIVNNNSMYKVGDFVLANGSRGAGGWSSQIVQLLDLSVGSKNGKLDKNSDFVAKLSNGYTYTIANSNIERKAKLEEIKTDLLSEDELLQVAKQFYPIGTKFRTIYGDDELLTVVLNNHLMYYSQKPTIIVSTDKGNGDILTNGAAIWSKSKGWAKIINSPIQESDNFVLPEKWCITTTEESNDIICDWYVKYNNSRYLDRTIGNHFCMNGKFLSGWMNSAPEKKEGHTEITFDQFKKYVLNKSEVVKENGSGLTMRPEKSINDLGVIFDKDGYTIEPHPAFIKENVSKKLTSPKIIPIKVRNCNITETKSTRTRVKIIKKSII